MANSCGWLGAWAAVGLFGASQALAALIDFEGEAPGPKPNGYTVAGHPFVVFSDTVGSGLNVDYYGGQGLGMLSLAVDNDSDGSRLQIDFLKPVNYLKLWYGNDDPGWADVTDLAWLEIWNGATLIATVTAPLNLNDLMDQAISYSGSCFDRAYFWYGDAQGNPFTTGPYGLTGLIEIVDNIEYTFCGTTVPEGGMTFGLLALGVAALRTTARMRRA